MEPDFPLYQRASLEGIPVQYVTRNTQGEVEIIRPTHISNFLEYAYSRLIENLPLPETVAEYPAGLIQPPTQENLRDLKHQWNEYLRNDLNKYAYYDMGISKQLQNTAITKSQIVRLYEFAKNVYQEGYTQENIFFSQPRINSKSYLITFQNNLSGQDIFNKVSTNQKIKAVHYFSGQHDLLKIHVDENGNPLISKKWLQETYHFEQDPRFLHLVLSENNVITLDLQEGNFLLEHGDLQQFRQEILQELPMKILETREIGLGGFVDLFGININPILFGEMLTVRYYRQYIMPGFYLLNDRSILHGSVEIDIRLEGKIVTHFTISNGTIAEGHNVITDYGQEKRFSDRYSFLRIYFNRSIDENYLRFARFFLRFLLIRYWQLQESLRIPYEKIAGFLPDGEISEYIGIPNLTKNRVTNRKIIKKIFPTLFVSGYARCGCVSDRQPNFSEHPPAKLESIPFDIKDKEGNVIQRLYFYCDQKKYNKIDLKQNTVLPNRILYPQIPCCFQSRAIPKGKSSGQILTTQYLIQPGSTSLLINNLAYVLQSIFDWDMALRYGLPELTNSNSVLYGLYIATETYVMPDANLDKYHEIVKQIRAELANQFPILAKSELYDYTLQEITSMLADPSHPLDLRKFLSILQQYFQVNIVMFNNNSESNYLELPRGYPKHGYFQLNPNIPTVLFYYNKSESRADLLFGKRGNDFFLTITPQETVRISQFLQNLRGVLYMDRFLDNGAFINLVSVFWQEFGKVAVSQWLDHRGMCRMFDINIEGNQRRTIICMPVKPLYCQYLPQPVINYWQLSEVIAFFTGKFYSYVLNSDGQCVGLWVRWGDFHKGLFLPTYPAQLPDELAKLPLEAKNPVLDITGHGQIVQIDQLEKIARIILQVAAFLFTVFVSQEQKVDVNYLLEQFSQLYMLRGDDINYSYDITGVRIKFPETNGKSIGELIAEISEYLPNLFISGKLFLSTDKIYQGVKFSLFKILQTHGPHNLLIPQEIYGILSEARDFQLGPREILFMDRFRMLQWGSESYDNPRIRYSIDFLSMLEKEPFFFSQTKGVFFIIQNVAEGSFLRAYNVSHNWRSSVVNLGYNADYYRTIIEQNSYTILKINKNLTLSKTAYSSGHILLLQYTEKVWAAVLPLIGKNGGL